MERQIVSMVTGLELSLFRAGDNVMISNMAEEAWNKLKEHLTQDCINPVREDAVVVMRIEWRSEQ